MTCCGLRLEKCECCNISVCPKCYQCLGCGKVICQECRDKYGHYDNKHYIPASNNKGEVKCLPAI